jgi:hypothetical protein
LERLPAWHAESSTAGQTQTSQLRPAVDAGDREALRSAASAE